MSKKPKARVLGNHKIGLFIVIGFLVLGGLALALHSSDFQVLQTRGEVGHKEKNLLIITTILGLLVVIPVFVMTFWIAWRYREGNEKANYRPDQDSNRLLEFIWWGIPIVIITALAIITWNSSHKLDPNRKLISSVKPLNVQVIALQWRWLFIYPDQHVATINYVNFPDKTPINFEITSDAPMNSFWIPQLGGQIYAMSGMSTHLSLIADEVGAYKGRSANISGEGFSDMSFAATALSKGDFNRWVKSVKLSSTHLDVSKYLELAKPSRDNGVAGYSQPDAHLYDKVVMKYMTPGFDMRSKYVE